MLLSPGGLFLLSPVQCLTTGLSPPTGTTVEFGKPPLFALATPKHVDEPTGNASGIATWELNSMFGLQEEKPPD